jgi:glycosyltransferase involved in cell wall biosynthesis
MAEKALNILQVGTFDRAGGAERIAENLMAAYRQRGHRAGMAVGARRGSDAEVFTLEQDALRGPWARWWLTLEAAAGARVGKVKGAGRVQQAARAIGQPRREGRRRRGEEDFDFPATRDLLEHAERRLGWRADLLHGHNLHGGYFDLRELPALSARLPVLLTLHDAWLLSGHCAHSLGCERWTRGCGACPDLTIYPAVPRDATAWNWQRKQAIYARSRLYVATPSRWLMDQVERSMLRPGIVEARVIPNGVDTDIFCPASQKAARAALGVPAAARMVLFAAAGIRSNAFKDYATLRTAIGRAAERASTPLLFVALGEAGGEQQVGQAVIRFVPFCEEPRQVARYFQAADVYVHAARADTFPNAVLEAMACARPVVASAVGGIPEQVTEGETGFLTPPGDAEAMAAAIASVVADESLAQRLGEAGRQRVRERFELSGQVEAYLAWYEEMMARFTSPAPADDASRLQGQAAF